MTPPNIKQTETLLLSWWECKMELLFGKTVWQFLRKLDLVLMYDPSISLLDSYLNEWKAYVHTKICTRVFIEALFIIRKIGNHQQNALQ